MINVAYNAIEDYLTQFCSHFIDSDDKLARDLKSKNCNSSKSKNEFLNSQFGVRYWTGKESMYLCESGVRVLRSCWSMVALSWLWPGCYNYNYKYARVAHNA